MVGGSPGSATPSGGAQEQLSRNAARRLCIGAFMHRAVLCIPVLLGCSSVSYERDRDDGSSSPPWAGPDLPTDAIARTQVSVGMYTSCAVAAGDLLCWGTREIGGMPTDERSVTNVPQPIEGLDGIVDLHMNLWNACALRFDGSAWCWGENQDGQLGIPSESDYFVALPMQVPSASGLIDISVGTYATCGLTVDATAVCWGCGNVIDPAARTHGDFSEAVAIPGLADVVQVDVGRGHACALLGNGSVRCWGDNRYGQVSQPPSGGSKYHPPVAVPGIDDAMSIAAYQYLTCALHADRSVSCWGNLGDLGVPRGDDDGIARLDLPPVQALVPGLFAGAVLLEDGTLVLLGELWGVVGADQPTGIARGLATAAVGTEHVCGTATDDGSVVCLGSNDFGQLGDGTFESRTMLTEVVW
jgi:alpha-tubulin suppressor-like RCC1 family protein